MYWPTMDDNLIDVFVDATTGTKDTWWSKFINFCILNFIMFLECPNGHDYFVQDVCNSCILLF